MNILGPFIRQKRLEKKLTQDQLVARCNLMGWGISRGTLAKIEAQVRCIDDREVGLLAKALKIEVNHLYQDLEPIHLLEPSKSIEKKSKHASGESV